MRYRLYIDTSVFGALFDKDEPHRVALTRSLLERLANPPFVSHVGRPVLEEMERAPVRLRQSLFRLMYSLAPRLLEETPGSVRLVEAYLKARVLPAERTNDLRHIALATVSEVDALVSWNFRDIVNLGRRVIVARVNRVLGYPPLDIISPLEVQRG